MARVNDGNLLQHFTECHVARALAAAGEGGLRLVATHAMAPFEAAGNATTHAFNARLRGLLDAPRPASDVAVLRAYAATGASVARYPNSAELLGALVGRDAVCGVLCETDAEARLALEGAWRGSAVAIEGRSWRDALAAGALFPAETLERPWLVSMDPYAWLLDGEAQKARRGPRLCRDDLEPLRRLLAAHVNTGRPGAFTVFVYKADPEHAKAFRSNALRLADRLGLERVVLGIDAPDGTRHLGILMTSLLDLAAGTAEAWHALLAHG